MQSTTCIDELFITCITSSCNKIDSREPLKLEKIRFFSSLLYLISFRSFVPSAIWITIRFIYASSHKQSSFKIEWYKHNKLSSLLHPKTVHIKAGSQYEPYSDFGCSSNTVDFGDLRFTLAHIFSRQLKKRRSRFRLILSSRLQELHEGMIWSLVCAVFLDKPFF